MVSNVFIKRLVRKLPPKVEDKALASRGKRGPEDGTPAIDDL